MTGLLFSAIDMMRRASLEEMLIKEERAEINKELRQGKCFLYLRRQALRLMISVSLSIIFQLNLIHFNFLIINLLTM